VPARLGFDNLQAIKLKIWYLMGLHAKRLNELVKRRLQKVLSPSVAGKLLGIRFPSKGPWVTRRYTLIPKKRQKLSSNTVTKEDVLIDVELFALDLNICYYSVTDKKVQKVHLGGILDMALMRPNEMGYEIGQDKNQGVMYLDKTTNKMKTDKRILFAGKRFLVEDVYLMQLLGLRPNKISKDRKRLYQFATTVLGVKGVTKSTAIFDIYKKIKLNGSASTPLKLTYPSRSFMNSIIKNVNPLKYSHRTTVPFRTKLLKDHVIGSHDPLPDFKETKSNYYFDVPKAKWVLSTDPHYIRNMYEYRPKSALVPFKSLKVANTLYGWDPVRNKAVPFKLRLKSSLIPFIGLKNINKIKLNEVRRT